MPEDVKNTEQISDSDLPDVTTEGEDKNTDKVEEAKDAESVSYQDQRSSVYDSVINQDKLDESETEEVADEAKAVEEEKPEEESNSVEDSIQKKIDKRIGKEVAKRKSAEEQLEELKAKLEALEGKKIEDEPKSEEPHPDGEPTNEQIVAYIAKMNEEGKYEEAAKANLYAIELAEKRAIERLNKESEQKEKINHETQQRLIELVNDYTVYEDREKGVIDVEHPLNLSNPQSLIRITADRYFNDKDLASRNGYNNQDKVLGYRLAANDAYRDLMELSSEGKLDLTAHKKKKEEQLDLKPKRRIKSELADSTGESAGFESAPKKSTKSIAEQEIERRKKMKSGTP